LGLPTENVRIIAPFVGGGYGGKSASEQAVEAARLARQARKPVMVIWSREKEFFFDTFRPAAVVKIRSGLTGGQMAFWDYKVYLLERGAVKIFTRYPLTVKRSSANGASVRGSTLSPSGPDSARRGPTPTSAPAICT
jgi:isoquinoline 1-oxidoreductase